ncbi:MAG: molybdopterin-dependent oxidoreductase, partial [Chloroflexi bacterium]|nr:molybdopterin-dependent oxidoreductase [Chloroflexota bacterium]
DVYKRQILLNGRKTRLDKFASHSIRYAYGEEVNTLRALLAQADLVSEGLDDILADAKSAPSSDDIQAAATVISEANNLIIFAGGEGLTATQSHALAQACSNLLVATGHVGRVDNGLIMVWPGANLQGAFDAGFHYAFEPGYQPVEMPGLNYDGILAELEAGNLPLVYIAGADLVFDSAEAEKALRATSGTIIVQDMFLTATAELADIVLPTQSIGERDGTYTSGERRVQRFYAAIEPMGESLPDWEIAQMVGAELGQGEVDLGAASVFIKLTKAAAPYAGLTYQSLAVTEEQWPDVGGEDLYYGGTAFTNDSGSGMQWTAFAEDLSFEPSIQAPTHSVPLKASDGEFVVVPVTMIYDRETVVNKTDLLQERVPDPFVMLNPADAEQMGLQSGDPLEVVINDQLIHVEAALDAGVPSGVLVLPRRLQTQGAPTSAMLGALRKLEAVSA